MRSDIEQLIELEKQQTNLRVRFVHLQNQLSELLADLEILSHRKERILLKMKRTTMDANNEQLPKKPV